MPIQNRRTTFRVNVIGGIYLRIHRKYYEQNTTFTLTGNEIQHPSIQELKRSGAIVKFEPHVRPIRRKGPINLEQAASRITRSVFEHAKPETPETPEKPEEVPEPKIIEEEIKPGEEWSHMSHSQKKLAIASNSIPDEKLKEIAEGDKNKHLRKLARSQLDQRRTTTESVDKLTEE
jgi:hypothetical protein